MSILFIDGTMKPPSESRTHQLATAYLESFVATHGGEITHLDLKSLPLAPLTAQDTALRDQLIGEKNDTHNLTKYAIQFAQADHIVLAAPYWDLSFPALVKVYVEHICGCNITFAYGEHGVIPLCKAKTFTYITTSGGEIYPSTNLGYDYLAALCKGMFGIADTRCLTAQKLDMFGEDVEKLMAEAKAEAVKLAKQ